MKVWISPDGNSADLTNEIGAKSVALGEAAARGARFLALPVENARDAATWLLASFRSPVTAVPLPPGLPIPSLEARLAQLPAGTVVLPGALQLARPPATLPPLKAGQEIWAVIFTSGSSAEPKGVALSGDALRSSAEAHAAHSGQGDACWLLDLPLYHVGGLSVLTRALFLGSPVALGPSRFDPLATAAWVDSGLIGGLSLVPTTLHRLLETSVNPSRLALILLGGAPASDELLSRARERGAPVRLTYGMTEHASQIASERAPGSGLEPLPGVEVRLRPDGEILVRSPMLARGFFRDGLLDPLPLENGFFATGDLGGPANGKLTISGRKSELIISGGMKLFPLEVERALQALPEVADCAVLSRPDEEWGEAVCAAVVETEPGSFDQEKARAELKKSLEARKVPRHWFLVQKIPRSAAGKILRAELRALIPIRN